VDSEARIIRTRSGSKLGEDNGARKRREYCGKWGIKGEVLDEGLSGESKSAPAPRRDGHKTRKQGQKGR
jgi:hypothetical protein